MSDTPLDLIRKLVSIPTVSRDSNMDLIEFVRSHLAGHGIESHIVPNADGTKANLYATVGPEVEGGVVLSGHTDVVPVDGQPWDSDPFTVEERDGRLYGRGTADMKSFSAIALALVPEMLQSGLKRPIHFALSYDEELGCLGAPDMIGRIAKALPRPRAVIVGEPTSMRVVTAHKGMMFLETVVTGREAHSSQTHRGVSAVMTAAGLIEYIGGMAREAAEGKHSQAPFEPPYTSIHVGTVHGGTAMNIISRECRFEWDIRWVPEDVPEDFVSRFERYCKEEILPAMRAVAPESDIVTRTRCRVPAMRPETDGGAEALARQITGYNDTDAVAYGTEGGQFQEGGFSTVICGPGSIDQAHKPNEFIEISQVEECTRFLRRLIELQAA